jgi:uncharacterized phiE125 gp8 family phage protein
MPLILNAGPSVEPVSLAEAKAHLRLDGSDEDTLIGSLIVTSRLHIESALGLSLVTQSWSWFFDAWPRGAAVMLPLRPVQSIAAVRLYDEAGDATTVAADTYLLDGASSPARLVRQGALVWHKPGRAANGIEVAFTSGYGDAAADVPEPIRQALRLLIAHWYEHRTPFEVGAAATPAPGMVEQLLAPYRLKRV